MSAAEVGYIAASGAVAVAVTTTGIVAARIFRPAAEAFCTAVRGGYSVTLTVALKPPASPKPEIPPAAPEAAAAQPASVPAPVQAVA